MKTKLPIYIIIGTRAQLIKMAPIMRLLEKEGIKYNFLYTQQHKATISDLIENFKLETPYLNIIQREEEARTIKLFLGWGFQMLLTLLNPFSRKKILKEGRGLIITHGDTATTAWAAIYARTSFCQVMHVESGMRSHNLLKPFPEELMRLITFFFTNYYVCPYQEAVDNLRRFRGKKLNVGANPMYDAFMYAHKNMSSKRLKEVKTKFNLPDKFALVSIHRYENIFKEDKFIVILDLLKHVSKKIQLVMVLHPATEKQLKKIGAYRKLQTDKHIALLKRQDFLNFVAITKLSEFMITDGGSNQQEMSYLGKPTLLMRDITESKEGIGKNIVISYYNKKIIDDFVVNYTKYQYPIQKITPSPSKLTVDLIKEVVNKNTS